MAEFLTTYGISSKLEEIINYAQQELILISPYFQLSETFYSRMCEASERDVNITIVFGKEKLKDDEFNAFAEIPRLELLYCHNLHAKCYLNEEQMVIASMNMYAYSQMNNREMGVSISHRADKELYDKALQEAHSIMRASELISSNRRHTHDHKEQKEGDGYCIRCRSSIYMHPGRPYCADCFSTWVEFENPYYQENFCHACGDWEETSMSRPLCYDCYKTIMAGSL